MTTVLCIACDHEYDVAIAGDAYDPCPHCGGTFPKQSLNHEKDPWFDSVINAPHIELSDVLQSHWVKLLQRYADGTISRDQLRQLCADALDNDSLFEQLALAHEKRMGRSEQA